MGERLLPVPTMQLGQIDPGNTLRPLIIETAHQIGTQLGQHQPSTLGLSATANRVGIARGTAQNYLPWLHRPRQRPDLHTSQRWYRLQAKNSPRVIDVRTRCVMRK